jgi:hypothetical protein
MKTNKMLFNKLVSTNSFPLSPSYLSFLLHPQLHPSFAPDRSSIFIGFAINHLHLHHHPHSPLSPSHPPLVHSSFYLALSPPLSLSSRKRKDSRIRTSLPKFWLDHLSTKQQPTRVSFGESKELWKGSLELP